MTMPPIPGSVVLAHHWLVTYRGGEKVLEEFRRIWPDAPIATLVYRAARLPTSLKGNIISSPLQNFPLSWKFYKQLLPLHPWAIKRIRLPSECGLLVSSDASLIKGLRKPPGARHVCYCHSPPRYIWDMINEYVGRGISGKAKSLAFRGLTNMLRDFDVEGAQGVDSFIANSSFVADRITRFYSRMAKVVFPPVEIERFPVTPRHDGSYLIVGQAVAYKRLDIAIEAFAALDRVLYIIGEGPELRNLRKLATPNVHFLGWQSNEVVNSFMSRCRAFIYPQIEDFGITSVEAQAGGKPVIAFAKGGALDTVIHGQTGLLFHEQTAQCLRSTISAFERIDRDWSLECRRNASRFEARVFRDKIRNHIQAGT